MREIIRKKERALYGRVEESIGEHCRRFVSSAVPANCFRRWIKYSLWTKRSMAASRIVGDTADDRTTDAADHGAHRATDNRAGRINTARSSNWRATGPSRPKQCGLLRSAVRQS
jgi:hypothetical protein